MSRRERLTCEVRSVNHRFVTTKIRLPPPLSRLEQWVDARVQSRFARGSIEVQVWWRGGVATQASRFQPKVADAYLAQLRKWLESRGLRGGPGAAEILALPGVFVPTDPEELSNKVKPQLERVVEAALDQLAAMREREGTRLVRALRREVKTVSGCAARLARLAPQTVVAWQQRLAERVRALLQGTGVASDPAAIAREVALFAERSDVTEELDRLKSHEAEFEKLLAKSGPIGRELEFLVQEMGREVQTVGSKAPDAAMLAEVRVAKASLEKLREQVQNLE